MANYALYVSEKSVQIYIYIYTMMWSFFKLAEFNTEMTNTYLEITSLSFSNRLDSKDFLISPIPS